MTIGRNYKIWSLCANFPVKGLLLLSITCIVLSGCGGSSDSGTSGDESVTVSGTVQKGLFTSLIVNVKSIDVQTGKLGEALPVIVDGQNYSVEINKNQTVLLEATGIFTNDVNGTPVTLDQPLKTVLTVESQDAVANINLATTLSAEKILQALPGSTQPVADVINQQEAFVNTALGLPAGTQPSQLDYSKIQSTTTVTDPNLQLLLLSAGIVGELTGNQFFADGFGSIVDGFVSANTPAEAASTLVNLTGLAANVIYQQVLQNAGYDFLPGLLLVGSPVLTCITDGTCAWQTPGGPTVSVVGSTIYEAEGQARITVRLGEISTAPVSFFVNATPGTATDGVDYIGKNIGGLNGFHTIPAGQSQLVLDLPIIIDAASEAMEDINISIVSQTQTYPVLQGLAKIFILDGAPPDLNNQDASNMEIRSVEAAYICTPAGDCGDLNTSASLGIADGNSVLIVTKIDLAALCADSANCPEQSHDWLVDFYLVAKGSSGENQGEVSLGPYIYNRQSVQLVNQTTLFRYPWLSIGGDDVDALALAAQNNSWDLKIEARLGQPAITKAASLPSIISLPSSVLAGETEIPLGTVFSVSTTDVSCPAGSLSVNAEYLILETSLQTGSLCIELDQTDPTANPATVVAGSIELETSYLKLPAGVSIRVISQFAGVAWVSPAALKLFPTYLHAEGWPFEILLTAITLTPAGIEIGYSDMHYLMKVDYSTQDPRNNGQLFSNDIYYSGVSGHSGTLLLNPDGIAGDISVAQATGNTAFPKAQLQWQAFSQTIDQSRLQPVQADISNLVMQQSTACNYPGCDADESQDWQVTATNAKLDGEGYLLADAVNQRNDQVAVFGARGNGVFAWSRPDDLTLQQNMKLALPGYVMPAGSRVSDYLLAHLNDTPAADNLARYPLGSDAAVDGNYHPVGLSVGPEVYRDVSGQPVLGDGQNLENKNLTINNGVDAAFDLASSVAVKYVLRNAGVTGVFNVAASSLGLNTAAQFYGYPLTLSRFAVRATDNQLDSYTWIDGQLSLQGDAGGPSGLDIYFSNLEINCAAQLGNVDLLYERCDGNDNNDNSITDENCAPRLYSWQTDMDIFAAGFSSSDSGVGSGQSCAAETQYFTLNHQLFFAALNKPVAFETQWDKDGYLVAQTSGELPVYRFDRSAEGKGFPIKTSSAQLASGQVDGDGYGWLELPNTTLGVTFWNAFDADLRLANRQQISGLAAEPTVVLPGSQLVAQQTPAAETNKQLLQRTISNKVDIDAQYEWGNTGFGFTLPVYYQPYQLDPGNSDVDAQGRQSRFVGRTLSYDLFVMDANAGINFIEPDRTKLSFGASADFERLGNLSFQIDPTDPASAAAVDDLLISVKIINTPLLAPALADFLDTVDVINRAAGRGLDEVIQSGLELSVEEIGKAAASITANGQDPFVTASETLALINSGPQQAIAMLADELKNPLNEKLFGLELELRNAITDLGAAPDNEVDAKINVVLGVLDQVVTQANAVNSSIDNAIISAKDMIAQAQSVITDLETATNDIDQVLLQSVAFVETSCSDGFVLNAEGNGYLDQVAVRFATVRQLGDIIRNSNRLFDVAETLAKDSAQKSRLNTAKRRIREATTELLGYLDTADQAVRSVVCAVDNVDEAVAKALNLTADIRTQANQASVALLSAYVPIDNIRSLHDTLSSEIIDPVNRLSLAFRQAVNGGSAAATIQAADCILLELSNINTNNCQDLSQVANFGVNAAVSKLFGSVKVGANKIIDDAAEEVSRSISQSLPGAYMTPQQLRELLVTEIMRSAPINELRLTMDKHFAEIGSSVNGLVLQYVDQLNLVIQSALAGVTGPVNDALSEATSVVRNIPVQAAGIDGFATIAGSELERAHIGAGWTMRGGDEDSPTTFKAALDAESWSAKHIPETNDLKTPTACGLADASSLLDVTISAYGLPLNVMAADIEMEKLYLGFTLEQNSGSGPALIPIGIFGGINTMGEIGFTDAVVIDPAFAAGLGELQTYIGASASAVFSSLEAEVAFFVGRACPGNTALIDLDPDAAKFITVPDTGFKGAYLRGGATIPLIPGGCFLNLGVSADFGSWLIVGMPSTFGGLVGGGAVGELGCIASIKGKVRVAGNASTDGDLKLVGEAWGVAGAGFDCDPGTWTSVQRSRDDNWCGTGDAQTDAIFENGEWDITTPSVDMIF